MKRAVGQWCLALSFLISCGGCGYIGSPLPPALNLPNRVSDLTAVQRGSKLVIQFTMPKTTTEAMPIQDEPEAEVRIGPSGPRFDLTAWLGGSKRLPDQGSKTRYETPAEPYEGKDVVIAVRLRNAHGRDAGWSNFVAVAVTATVPAPTSLQARATAQGVEVSWQGGGAPLYRVYRKGAIGDYAPLGDTRTNSYIDATAEYGKTYTYFVQGIQKAGDKTSESDAVYSEAITPVDTFPPAVPRGLKVILGTKSVELSWERDVEPDLAGYQVFRSEGDGPYIVIAQRVTGPSYSDRAVKPGVRYRYQVLAFDQTGNKSERSAPVDAVLP